MFKVTKYVLTCVKLGYGMGELVDLPCVGRYFFAEASNFPCIAPETVNNKIPTHKVIFYWCV